MHMSVSTNTFNVPGRVIDFYSGGEAYNEYINAIRAGRKPEVTRNLQDDELALFEAVDAGKVIRPSKGGYYVRAELTELARKGLAYWAETLAGASADNAAWESDAANDLRAARKTLERLR